MRVGLTAAHGAGAPLSCWRAARGGQKRKPRSRSAASSSLGATFSGVLLNAHSSELAEPLANCTESSCEDPDEVEISCLNWLRHHISGGGETSGGNLKCTLLILFGLKKVLEHQLLANRWCTCTIYFYFMGRGLTV